MAVHLIKGQQAELKALDYLQKQGLQLITKNYRCKYGEIDLVMREKETLIFIEVRYRKSDKFGSAIESIHQAKQRKLLRTSQHFLQHYPASQFFYWRFDIIGLDRNHKIDWIKSAFEVQY